jgi:hypothetical protein
MFLFLWVAMVFSGLFFCLRFLLFVGSLLRGLISHSFHAILLLFLRVDGSALAYAVFARAVLAIDAMAPKKPAAWITPHWVPRPPSGDPPYKRKSMLPL